MTTTCSRAACSGANTAATAFRTASASAPATTAWSLSIRPRSPRLAAPSVAAFSSSAAAANLAHPRRRRRFSLLDHPLIATPPPSAEEAVNNILYNTPPPDTSPVTRHILNCLVNNEPGVLSRVSGILAGRGFNIDSLVVAKTEVPDLSRMTVVLREHANTVEQARRQLEDLVPVWAVLDYTHMRLIERELLLVKVAAVPVDYASTADQLGSLAAATAAAEETIEDLDASEDAELSDGDGFEPRAPLAASRLLAASAHRQAVTELARLFRARVVHVTYDDMVLELCAAPEKVDALLKLLKPYGIVEATRSGSIAMTKTPVEGSDAAAAAAAAAEEAAAGAAPAVDTTQLPPG
ncbi:hypothetical protein HK405_011362 [Cladochytrium tenue]|nr:hypothetical protein HK405_011362 [Cladochytrium tenue]